MGGQASSTIAKIYVKVHEQTAISTALNPLKFWGSLVGNVSSILKCTYLEKFCHNIENPHENIKFTMENESNGDLAFLDTSLKRNNGNISVLVYRKPPHIGQCLQHSSHHQTSCKESVVSSFCNKANSTITNEYYLNKASVTEKWIPGKNN